MHMLMRSRGARAATVPLAVGVLAAAAVTATSAPASADTNITVAYPVHGSTHLKAPNTTVTLGPGTLRTTLNANTGNLTASLSLPTAKVAFLQFGFIPVRATTEFIQDGPTKGKLDWNTGAVKTTSKIILKITSMSVAGIPQDVGKSCESATPAVVTLTSRPGFSLVFGGKLAGTYTITPFAHCGLLGLLTPLINATITGPGNTITFTLGPGKAV